MSKLCFALILTLCAGAMAQSRRGHEGGNGGGSCDQTVDIIKPKLHESVKRAESIFKEYFAAEVFSWFLDKTKVEVVDVFTPGCKRRDGCNFPAERRIELNRSTWCPLSEPRKAELLFHEYLSIMAIEGDNEYTVSSKLTYVEDSKKWTCSTSAYCPSQLRDGYDFGKYPRPYNHTSAGATAEEAVSNWHSEIGRCSFAENPIFCHRLGSHTAEEFGRMRVYYYCAEQSNVSNSCVERK